MHYISVSRSKKFEPNAHRYFHRVSTISLDQFCKTVTQNIWSPIVWSGGIRERLKFEECKYAALDFDDGVWTLKRAEEWVNERGFAAIIGTSKSHQIEKVSASGKVKPACDRFRLIVPFLGTMTCRLTYEYNMRLLAAELPCDSSCVDAARFFYPCKEIVYAAGGGTMGYKDLPPELATVEEEMSEAGRKEMAECRETGLLPAWVLNVLRWGAADQGSRHKLCYRLGANLVLAGYHEQEIVDMCMDSPIGGIGREDVARAVANGAARAREKTVIEGGKRDKGNVNGK